MEQTYCSIDSFLLHFLRLICRSTSPRNDLLLFPLCPLVLLNLFSLRTMDAKTLLSRGDATAAKKLKAGKSSSSRVRRIPQPSSDEEFWAAVSAQQVIEGSSILSWKQAGTPATERPGGIGGSTRTKNKGRGGAAAGNSNGALWCSLCDDKTSGRWLTRCKGAGGNGSRQQQTCSIWVHPACAWQVRSVAGFLPSSLLLD